MAADTADSKFKNLDELMPASVEDYVALVNAHISSGSFVTFTLAFPFTRYCASLFGVLQSHTIPSWLPRLTNRSLVQAYRYKRQMPANPCIFPMHVVQASSTGLQHGSSWAWRRCWTSRMPVLEQQLWAW